MSPRCQLVHGCKNENANKWVSTWKFYLGGSMIEPIFSDPRIQKWVKKVSKDEGRTLWIFEGNNPEYDFLEKVRAQSTFSHHRILRAYSHSDCCRWLKGILHQGSMIITIVVLTSDRRRRHFPSQNNSYCTNVTTGMYGTVCVHQSSQKERWLLVLSKSLSCAFKVSACKCEDVWV